MGNPRTGYWISDFVSTDIRFQYHALNTTSSSSPPQNSRISTQLELLQFIVIQCGTAAELLTAGGYLFYSPSPWSVSSVHWGAVAPNTQAQAGLERRPSPVTDSPGRRDLVSGRPCVPSIPRDLAVSG